MSRFGDQPEPVSVSSKTPPLDGDIKDGPLEGIDMGPPFYGMAAALEIQNGGSLIGVEVLVAPPLEC